MNTSGVFPSLGRGLTLTPGGEGAHVFGTFSCVIAGVRKSLHGLAQFCLTEEEQRMAIRVVGAAVVGRLAAHVGKIDTLSEHLEVDVN